VKILHNAYFVVDSFLADKTPVIEYHRASYVYGNEAKVDITKEFDLINGREMYTCVLLINGVERERGHNVDDFMDVLEAMGYQLGNHEGERVELTELGCQEVSLLSSIPYLPAHGANLGFVWS